MKKIILPRNWIKLRELISTGRGNRYLITLIFFCILPAACRKDNDEDTGYVFEAMEIKTQSLDMPESFSASIRGSRDVEIFPQVSGTIKRVCVTEGQHVKCGDILFIIDQAPYIAALQTAKANVKAAKARVGKAKLELESKKFLFDEKVVSDFELASAKSDLAMAEAELDQMIAQETDARISLSYTEIKSPVNGVVGTLPFRTGTLVNPSMEQPLTMVSDNAVMYVYFSINENKWREMIKAYDSADAAIENLPDIKLMLNDRSIYQASGRIVAASGIINQQTGSVSIRSEFPNPKGELMSGSIGNVIIPNTRKDAIIIPQRATNEIQDKLFVYKIENRDNSRFAKAVEIKADKVNDGKNYAVISGIAPGDTIISNGVGQLRDGIEIKISERKDHRK